MTKELVLKPKGLDALCPAEQAVLHCYLRAARQSCRKVMRDNWWHKETTEFYMKLVGELQRHDPLFTVEVLRREQVENGYPYK